LSLLFSFKIDRVLLLLWWSDRVLLWWSDRVLLWWSDRVLLWWSDRVLLWWSDRVLLWWSDRVLLLLLWSDGVLRLLMYFSLNLADRKLKLRLSSSKYKMTWWRASIRFVGTRFNDIYIIRIVMIKLA
jgi:hypothetical protein